MAAAFVLMAIFLKVPWLMIPASIIGFTGLVLQFCAATGWWSSWAVLWTVEPFAVGLPLLLIGLSRKIEGVKLAGIILCGLAGLGFAAMSTVLVTSLWITRLIGPVAGAGSGCPAGRILRFRKRSQEKDEKLPEESVEKPVA